MGGGMHIKFSVEKNHINVHGIRNIVKRQQLPPFRQYEYLRLYPTTFK